MKKAYTKPEIMFDDFSLATTIAAGCENRTNLQVKDACGIKYGPDMLFLQGYQGCTKHVEDGEYGYCYHNPTDLTNLFNSL